MRVIWGRDTASRENLSRKRINRKRNYNRGNKYYITPYGDEYYMYAITEYGTVLRLSKIRVVFESEIVSKEKE